jgi:putative flippase GtrA
MMGRLVASIRKLARYATVSAISTTTSLIVLSALVGTRTLSAGWANVVATGVGTVPSFELNRRWVWGKKGQRSLLGEIGPFCLLSFLGLALSTLAVSAAAGFVAHAGLSNTARTIAAGAANVGTFGALWVVQYLLLDCVLFKQTAAA